jgi:hypothetical protein
VAAEATPLPGAPMDHLREPAPPEPALAICSPGLKRGLMSCGQDGRMRNLNRSLLLVSIAGFVAACSSAAPTSAPVPSAGSTAVATQTTAPSSSDSTQTTDRAGVTVAVTWTGPAAGAVFEVKMDNHMIDLASVDTSRATLANDRGERLSRPTWDGGSSGHHREGKLTFGTSAAALFAGAKWIQLELPAVGDSSPRDFKWELPG